MVKQKEANRQSMILLQQADPSIQLLKALEDVASVSKTLEEERIQHQEKVVKLQNGICIWYVQNCSIGFLFY